jgi:predicted kinase
MLVLFRGLPGTGKTHLARLLVRSRPDLLVLSRDTLRENMIAHPTFSPEEKALVDELIQCMAGFLLGRGRAVLIDGMALSSAGRVEEFEAVARAHGADFKVIECVCAKTTALGRLSRDTGRHPAGDRGEALYYEVRARFQSLRGPSLTVDTDLDPAKNLADILHYLAGGARTGSPVL